MTLKVFVDTEFTDFFDTHLISIGMVAETGEHFYAEVPYPDHACSAFVQEAVVPLLGKVPNAFCVLHELRSRIITWLEIVRFRNEEVEICFDYQTDWDLFNDALDCRVPSWLRARNVVYEINELLRFNFHRENNLPEHHALYDAMANQHAFREKIVPSAG
jgi:hypothetical protein